MMRTPYKEAPLAASTLGALLALGLSLGPLPGCAPELPPAWRIAPDPAGPDGQPDGRGKLRLLAIQADPPEVAPGTSARLSALAVVHPRHGERREVEGQRAGTPWPRDLGELWLACRPAEGQPAPEACGLGSGTDLVELGEGPEATLAVPADAAPGTLLVTLVAAVGEGPRACLQRARAARGVVADANTCIIGVKRVKISTTAPRNRNPQIQRLLLEPADRPGDAVALAESGARVPAGAETLQLVVERAADAVEPEPDPDQPEVLRDEVLVASFFVTAGRLEAGRGGFTDPSCDAPCPQLPRSAVRWDPPAPDAAPLEAPDGLVYFFAVLRDDRGGLSYQVGRARLP